MIDFGSAQTINLGGVGIGVFARNLATGDNGSGAKASAVLVQNNPAVHMNIGGSGINVIALASSQGRDGASANALVDIAQTGISISGDILVEAKAVGGLNVARESKAHANLTLAAGAGGMALRRAMAQPCRDGPAPTASMARLPVPWRISLHRATWS